MLLPFNCLPSITRCSVFLFSDAFFISVGPTLFGFQPNMIHAVQDAQTACENTQQDHVASSPTHVPFSSSYTESSPMAVEAALPPDVGHSRHKHVSVSSSPLSLPKSSPTTPPVVNAQSSGAPTSDLIDVSLSEICNPLLQCIVKPGCTSK